MAQTQPDYWTIATRELAQRDGVMAQLILSYPNSVMSSRGQPFYTLVRSVVGQQISVKAADSIWARFVLLVPKVTPKHVLVQSMDSLRSVGLSARKAEYIHAVAEFFVQKRVGQAYWEQRTDNEIIEELSSIRGIGRWTAEMFLMFTLLRPNVFPVDDIGLLRGLEKNYHGARVTPSVARAVYFERFSPWASVATWYLWRSLDPVEVCY
ncbi:MAG: DNA-3-methyladenine glycosylase 2 family protein [Hydromonas sp.]|nr:DNA-3-methyladenine glycosylase 2 family protein [Hydromonas sp.]